MTPKQVGQIARLLNKYNRLTVQYTPESIYAFRKQYLFVTSPTNQVVGCVRLKKVQWYQGEVLHLCVHPDYRGQKIARNLLEMVEERAKRRGIFLLQCTIREENVASLNLFASMGYQCANQFYNSRTTHHLTIWQKVFTPLNQPLFFEAAEAGNAVCAPAW